MGLIQRLATPLRWLASRKKPATAPGGPTGPEPTRIALLGHTTSGKTVFYAMLYETLRNDPRVTLTPQSPATAAYMQARIHELTGLEDYVDDRGRTQTRTVLTQWPMGTIDTVNLDFSLKVVARRPTQLRMADFAGEQIGLSVLQILDPEVKEFFRKADCVFFMVDATTLRAEVTLQQRIASLIVILEWIAEGRDRAAIPLGIIFSKADVLAGFEHEEQAVLIPESFPVTSRTTFEQLRRVALGSGIVQREPAWAGEVARCLDATSQLIRLALHHADGFQVFFLSAVGKPEMRLQERGEPEAYPPRPIKSIGLGKPLLWWIDRHHERARVRWARRLALASWIVALIVGAGAMATHWPHRAAFHRSLTALESQSPDAECPKPYLSSGWIAWTHRDLWGRLAQQTGWDATTSDCEVRCPRWAEKVASQAGCVSSSLESCEQVQKSCYEGLAGFLGGTVEGSDGEAAREPAEGAPRPLVDATAARCREELLDRRRRAIGLSAARRTVSAKAIGLPLATRSIPLDRFDAPALQGPMDIAGACSDCVAGRLEDMGVSKDLQALVDIFLQIRRPTGENPATVLQRGQWREHLSFRDSINDYRSRFRDVEARDALGTLIDWFEARSFHLLKGKCSVSAFVDRETATTCVTETQAYEPLSPPRFIQPVRALRDAAVAWIRRKDSEALAQAGTGAPSAPPAPPSAALQPAAEVKPAGVPVPRAQAAAASASWRSITLVFLAKEPRTATFDVHWRSGPTEDWRFQVLHSDFEETARSICVARDASVEMGLNDTSGGRETLNMRSGTRTLTWQALVGQLTTLPLKDGGGKLVSEYTVDLGADVTARFRLEASDLGCF